MKQALRLIPLLLVSYLLQATLLPAFKVGGVMLDLLMITLYTAGYAYGTYVGIISGMCIAILVEVLSGDPGGLSLVYVAAGYFGSWVVQRMRGFTRVGNRALEYNVKRITPLVMLALAAAAKEFVYLIYFYLTGMDISFSHVMRVLASGVFTGAVGLVLMPLLFRYLRPKPKEKKEKRERKKRGKAKPVDPNAPPEDTPPEGKRKKRGRKDKAATKGPKESFLSMLNPVLDASTSPEEAEDDKPRKKDILADAEEDEDDGPVVIYKRPTVKAPRQRKLTEDELAAYKRPERKPKADTPPEDEDDERWPPDDEPPEGGMDE